jgi:LCP family protein required for cell wall assembly
MCLKCAHLPLNFSFLGQHFLKVFLEPFYLVLEQCSFGILMLLFLLISLIPSLIEFWQAPLGPELGFESTTTPISTLLSAAPPVKTLPPDGSDSPANTPTPVTIPTYTQQAACGNDPEMLILAVGIDYRKGTYTYGLADVIRVVKIDFVTPRVTVLAFPRDFWVEVPGISDHYGITHSKLNQSYFYGTENMGYYDGPGGGAGLLARTLDLNYGLRPEQYGVVNMYVLIEMIDAMGGVDIYLEEGIDARESPESTELWKIYPAGWNHLDGKRAVYYARIRHIDNVFGRTDRQTEILCAVKNKLLSPEAILGIPEMITAFSDNVLTDLSPAQLGQLACLAPQLSWDNIVFARFPENEMTGKTAYNPNMKINDFIWDMDNTAIRNYVSGFLAGTWPAPPVAGESDDSHAGVTQQLCPVYPDR